MHLNKPKPKGFRLDSRQADFLQRYGERDSTQLREDLDVLGGLINLGALDVAAIDLTADEASLIIDALSEVSCDVSYLSNPLENLQNTIANACRISRLEDAWQVSAEELDTKLRLLSPVGGLALIHMTRLFRLYNSGGRSRPITDFFPLKG